jgi:16S rRNA (guanine966-N2)-methyltransferase
VRVIAGEAKGRRLVAPKGRDVRPTSDRVREALFASLGDRVPGARVLDLFAGTGALAIEALSRGAARAVLVEHDPRAAAAIAENLRRTGLTGRAVVVRHDAARFCREPGEAFDVVLADPPYAEPTAAVHALLGDLAAAGGLAPGAICVLERDRHDPDPGAPPPAGLALVRSATYGDTVLRYWQ